MLDRGALLISSHALTTEPLVRAFQGLDTDGKSYDLAPGASMLTVALSQPLDPSDVPQSPKCGTYLTQNQGNGYI